MPRPPLYPLRFPAFNRRGTRFRRVRNTAQGVLYQNVEPQVGLPLWIRYNIPGQYWEYAIDPDANVFYRLKENPYVPSDIYFLNRGVETPSFPASGGMKMYVKSFSGTPKLCVLWENGLETILTTGPVVGFPSSFTSFWKLDETTGSTRVDSIGANNLANLNSVTQVAGKIGNASGFNGSTNYLFIADNPSVSMGAGVSCDFAFWVKFDTVSVTGTMFSKYGGGAGLNEFLCAIDGATGKVNWQLSADGTSFPTIIVANTFGALTPGVWYFVECYYDVVTGIAGIGVNRGSYDTASHGTGGIFNGTANFEIGHSAGGALYHNGQIDAFGFAKQILTTVERDNLYNSGLGLEP